MTVFEYLEAARVSILATRANGGPEMGASGREFSLAITAIEDAQMRYTRGLAMRLGKFSPADLEKDA
jgi:hypothetical protein